MSADLHIEGMGALGAILAQHLDAAGIPFTWSDTETEHVAWPASTGLVYPEGSDRSMADLAVWRHWLDDGLFAPDELIRATYVYRQKTIPHRGEYPTIDHGGGVHAGEPPAVVLDVPLTVRRARNRHANQRLVGDPGGGIVLRAHGGHRIGRYRWGWSAPVRLDVRGLDTPHTPVLVGRVVRRLTYAHPIPSRPGWWRAGSDLVIQTRPRRLDVGKHLARWRRDWATLYPMFPVLDIEEPTEAWRPEPAVGDPQDVHTDPDGAIHLPPMWHDGVRHCPPVIVDALSRAGLAAVAA